MTDLRSKPNHRTPEVTPEVTPDVDETAKGEQEPVAWMWKDGSLTSDPDEADGTWTKLYTAPPKREWVGLTEADKNTAIKLIEAGMFNLSFKYLEEKLKEKNFTND